MDHIDEYRQIIRGFAEKRMNVRIPNGLPQHATILIETMFLNASAEMRIFTQELHGEVFGGPEMQKAVRKFLSKPYACLMILLQNPKNADWFNRHPLAQVIRELDDKKTLHGSVVVKNATGSYTKDDANHFTVMDNDGFRFETNHAECKATANFNEPKTAKKLIDAFDAAFGMPSATTLFELKAS